MYMYCTVLCAYISEQKFLLIDCGLVPIGTVLWGNHFSSSPALHTYTCTCMSALCIDFCGSLIGSRSQLPVHEYTQVPI